MLTSEEEKIIDQASVDQVEALQEICYRALDKISAVEKTIAEKNKEIEELNISINLLKEQNEMLCKKNAMFIEKIKELSQK